MSAESAQAGQVTFGRLVVRRDSPRDIKMRGLEVFVDGVLATDLPYGREHAQALAAGPHTVRVSNRLVHRELDFDLAAGETAELRAGNVASGCTALPLVVFGIGPYGVFVERTA